MGFYSPEALAVLKENFIERFVLRRLSPMKPNELFEEIASIITGVVRRPFRDEPVTSEEYDKISDRILLLIAEQKVMQKEPK